MMEACFPQALKDLHREAAVLVFDARKESSVTAQPSKP